MEATLKYKHKPTFGSSFGNGWQVLGDEFLVLFLVTIILAVIDAPAQAVNVKMDPTGMFMHFGGEHFHLFAGLWASLGALVILFGLFALAYKLMLVPVFDYGSALMFVHAARRKKPDFATLVNGFKSNYFHIILANLLVTALVMIGFFAIIVPGIIIACRLAFVSYLVMDKNLDPIAAVEESWRMTRGHGWTIFFMAIVSFFIIVLGFALCFVGIFPAIVWVRSSFACLYEAVREKRELAATPAIPPSIENQ